MENDKKAIENWQKQWMEAQSSGIFANEPKKEEPEQLGSFFGVNRNEKNESVSSVDAQYWRSIALYGKVSKNQAPDPIDAAKMLKEQEEINMNPVQVSTIGKDQDLTPAGMGLTFDEEDLNELQDLKNKLFDLENKLNTSDGLGENSKKFEGQIKDIQSKIDELSDSLSKEISLVKSK